MLSFKSKKVSVLEICGKKGPKKGKIRFKMTKMAQNDPKMVLIIVFLEHCSNDFADSLHKIKGP